MKFINDVPDVLEQRSPVGILVSTDCRFPHAHQLYEVTYKDGTSEIVRGGTVHITPTYANLYGSKKEKKRAAKSFRPELRTNVMAAGILIEEISKACWEIDDPRRAPPRNRIGTSALRKRRSEPLNQKGKKK